MGKRRKKLLIFGIFLALAGVFLLVQPGCPLRTLTGIPCPGCGMTRAWLAFLRLDFAGAFRQHPLFLALPLTGWLAWKEFRPFRRLWVNVLLTAGLVLLLLTVYGIRLYFGLF